MLQTLLAERFHMRSHFEDTPMSAYVLLAGKDRKKLHPKAPDATVRVLVIDHTDRDATAN